MPASDPRITIFGASGFIGAALCERLYRRDKIPFRACIHSFANAARLARFPIDIVQADVLDYPQVLEAVRGSQYVVNCAWGTEAAMIKGLKNIGRAAKACKVEKFIHLGSISVHEGYADQPGVSEDAPPKPLGVYGEIKKAQDQIVFDLHKSGLPSIILAAGRVIGPYSGFILRTIEQLRSRPVLLVDEGQNPSNHVHVDNVAESIMAALNSDKGWGERYFVTDPGRPTWGELISDLAGALGVQYRSIPVRREDVLSWQASSGSKPRGFLTETVRGMASSQFRKGLGAIPLFNAVERYAYRTFTGLEPQLQKKIKAKLSRPIVIHKARKDEIDLADPLAEEQTRRTYFAPDKIIQRLGYAPPISREQGMQMIRAWCEFAGVAGA